MIIEIDDISVNLANVLYFKAHGDDKTFFRFVGDEHSSLVLNVEYSDVLALIQAEEL